MAGIITSAPVAAKSLDWTSLRPLMQYQLSIERGSERNPCHIIPPVTPGVTARAPMNGQA